MCIRQRPVGFVSKIVGVRLGFLDNLLGPGPHIRKDLVRLTLRSGEVLVCRPLRQGQHLQSLPLGIGVGHGLSRDLRLPRGLRAGGSPGKQRLGAAFHTTVGHRRPPLM